MLSHVNTSFVSTHLIFLAVWTKCATITTSSSAENYVALQQCPQTAGHIWKMEDSSGVCAKNDVGWVDWEYPNHPDSGFGNDAQQYLGYYLDILPTPGWISIAMTGSSNCGIFSTTGWKDTLSVQAYQSSGSIDVYYS